MANHAENSLAAVFATEVVEARGRTVITGHTALRSVECCLELMSRFPVFYCSLPDIGAGFKPVEASDAYEAEQIVQRQYPDAVTASLSDKVTDKSEIRRLFMEWLERI